MQYLSVLQLLILVTLANGSPVVAKRIFGSNFGQPLDGNIKFFDGRPLFGTSKTIRGIVVSIFVTSACAPMLGLKLGVGLAVAITAMAGDLLSSFLKRSLAMPPSSKAVGLDQVPESLLPLLALRQAFSLTALDIVAGTALFFVGRSKPLVEELERWLRAERRKLSSKNPLAKAMDYSLKRWSTFTRFLDDGRICMTNNAAERAVRGVAVGRRNWTFCGSDAGGQRAAVIFTLIETAKLCDVDSRAWLADVLARIADHPASRIEELLPWRWKAARQRNAQVA